MPQLTTSTSRVQGPRGAARWLVVAVVAMCALGVLAPTANAAAAVFPNTPVAADRVNGVGFASVVIGNTVIVGGTFTSVRNPAGTTVGTRTNLAAFNATTGRFIPGFKADTNGQVTDLAFDGTNLYVSGYFTTINGIGRGRLAALDPTTGAVRTNWVSNATGLVNAIAIGGNNLYLGGSFGSIGGAARPRVAAVRRINGSVDTTFNVNVNATVYAMGAQPDGSRVYVGGLFTLINGTSRPYLAAVSGVNGALSSPVFSGVSGLTLDIDVPAGGTRLAVSTGGSGNQGALFSLASGSKQWRQHCDGDGQAVKVIGTEMYSGFHEGCEGDLSIRATANSVATGVRITSFRPSFDKFWGVRDFEGNATVLSVAGDFTRVGGVPAQGFALFRTG